MIHKFKRKRFSIISLKPTAKIHFKWSVNIWIWELIVVIWSLFSQYSLPFYLSTNVRTLRYSVPIKCPVWLKLGYIADLWKIKCISFWSNQISLFFNWLMTNPEILIVRTNRISYKYGQNQDYSCFVFFNGALLLPDTRKYSQWVLFPRCINVPCGAFSPGFLQLQKSYQESIQNSLVNLEC